jgi:hypothetical protein
LQVAEEREEDVVHHVFAIADGDTAGDDIPQQRIAKPVEQDENVLLESRVCGTLSLPARRERREAQC